MATDQADDAVLLIVPTTLEGFPRGSIQPCEGLVKEHHICRIRKDAEFGQEETHFLAVPGRELSKRFLQIELQLVRERKDLPTPLRGRRLLRSNFALSSRSKDSSSLMN